MDFLKLVEEARSCRRFAENQALTLADLEWLIQCARLTPSGRNAQELRFITINQGPVLDKLFRLTRWAGALKDWTGPEPGERPTSFIAVLMPERGGEILCFDTGIACQTIQLAAASRKWGACMIYSFERKEAHELLEVKDPYKIALLIGLGVATEKRVIAPMPKDGSFNYWRDENQVHYVPKRDLNELIVARF